MSTNKSENTRDDFGGSAVLHIEVDGEPVHLGHPNTPATGNVGVSPTSKTVSFEVYGTTVTVDTVAFIDDSGGAV